MTNEQTRGGSTFGPSSKMRSEDLTRAPEHETSYENEQKYAVLSASGSWCSGDWKSDSL